MTNQTEDRGDVDDLPLEIAVEYLDHEMSPCDEDLVLAPGHQPFILFQMKQEGGAVVLDVTASLIPGEDDLIETLEVFFETMLAEREMRRLAALGVIVDEAVEEYLDEEQARRHEDAEIGVLPLTEDFKARMGASD